MSAHMFTVGDAATFRRWVEPDGYTCISWTENRERHTVTLRFPPFADAPKRLAAMLEGTVEVAA